MEEACSERHISQIEYKIVFVMYFMLLIPFSSSYAREYDFISHVTVAKDSSTISFFVNKDRHALIEFVEPKVNRRIINIGWCDRGRFFSTTYITTEQAKVWYLWAGCDKVTYKTQNGYCR